MRRTCLCLGILVVTLGITQPIRAQVMTNTEQERNARYPYSLPYDGEPYTQRYNYGTRGMFYFNGNARQLYYLDYLDRADRAKKFGHAMPVDPFFPEPPEEGVAQPIEAAPPVVVAPPVRVFGGFVFGAWRRR